MGASSNRWIKVSLVFLLCIIVLSFIRMAQLGEKIEALEHTVSQQITYEEFMLSFNNMYDAKANGTYEHPYSDTNRHVT